MLPNMQIIHYLSARKLKFMEEVKVIEIKKSIFEENGREADELRAELKKKGVFLLNLMSSPGSGKTTTLIATINAIKDKIKVAVMEAKSRKPLESNPFSFTPEACAIWTPR